MTDRPTARPARAHFSSGPCAKRPGWTPDQLAIDSLGRSHRSKLGKARLQHCIDLTRAVLGVPDTHRIGIVPGSDTGAYEMAMWSLLGALPVTMVAWESFGEGWVTDAVKQLKLDATIFTAPYGELPDLTRIAQSGDVCFTSNGTTSGVRVPNYDWIRDDREGLTLADATSAVFAQKLDWAKLDVVTFSWQKALGGEGGHGVLILGPRAVERLETYVPAWPLPKIFRLTSKGKLIEGIFSGETINTPSMLAVEDCIDALEWAQSIGGLVEMQARADANAQALDRWVQATPWVAHLAADTATRSNTSVCLTLPGAAPDVPKAIAALLEKEGVAFDIGGYRDAPPGLRIWCGSTVDAADIEALGPWLDWAHAQVTG
jgi:phosphoserine aminotransferase